MATLDPPFDRVVPGSHVLEAKVAFLWTPIGQVSVEVNEPFTFGVRGAYNALGRAGTFEFFVELLDRDAAAPRGPCRVLFNGTVSEGTYARSGAGLTFALPAGVVAAYPDEAGLGIEAPGAPPVRIIA